MRMYELQNTHFTDDGWDTIFGLIPSWWPNGVAAIFQLWEVA